MEKIKVLDLKAAISKKVGSGKLATNDWYFGCGERILNSLTMEEARDLITLLQFYEKRAINFDQTAEPFWHKFLQTHANKRCEFVKMMLASLSLGGTGIIDLRITAQIERCFKRQNTTVKAVLVQENSKNESDYDHKVIYDPFRYETVLWDGPLNNYGKDYDVSPLPEFSHGKTYYEKKFDEKSCKYVTGKSSYHPWSHGITWLYLLRELFGGNTPSETQKAVRNRIYGWLFSHLRDVPSGEILLRDAKSGRHHFLKADRYFDEKGIAYDPKTIYALRLYFEVVEKLPVIQGWETKDTRKAIGRITPENPIILVPAYNMKWNDDIVIHSSLLSGAEAGIKAAVVVDIV